MDRRTFLSGTAAALVSATPAAAQQSYPDRPMRLIAPIGPGTSTDIFARQVGNSIQAYLGQPMVVENRAGGGGQIGVEAVVRSPPDGYTLLLATEANLLITPLLFRNLPYDVTRDLAPVAGLATVSYIMVVSATLPVRSVADLVALARARPGQLSFGSTVVGSGTQIVSEVFNRDAGIEITHVPYNGGAAQLFGDLVTGRLSIMVYPYLPMKPYIDAGQLRPLATASAERLDWMPELPTLRELGFPRSVIESWFSIFAPARTSEARIGRLESALRQQSENAEFRTALRTGGLAPRFVSTADLANLLVSERRRLSEMVTLAGIHVE
jgi:tripartite-type tricarboxylate transporter receptor subunit TctC